MQSLRDFIGSPYAIFIGVALLIAWSLVLSFYQKNKKSKKVKQQIFKKAWFWGMTIFSFGIFFLIMFGKEWGLGTPEYFSDLVIYDDKIVLFDNQTTYYDSDQTNSEDYASHLRIHIVDRNTHEKIHEELIGTNYSTLIDDHGIFVVSNSKYYHSYADNKVYFVKEYDPETKTMTTIVENGETISVDGKDIEVFKIEVIIAILVTSIDGDQYVYDTRNKDFKKFEGIYDLPEKHEAISKFYLTAEHYNSDKTILKIGMSETANTFLFGEVITTYNNGSDYALIRSYKDMNKDHYIYTMVNDAGETLWQTDLANWAATVGSSGFENIQEIQFDKDLMYCTVNAYLFEIDLLSGDINWWVKL
ncbi:MAG: hypothetical protein R2780_13425 [Crocinitomicaceae bacterium]|nr:hypothetical protein [Crocinitomicaceae bacterium]